MAFNPDFFFDRKHVQALIERTNKRNLGRFGAFVRRRARSSLRRRKKVSAPGQPPSVRSTNPNATLKKILFALDPQAVEVVIGPVLLNQKHGYIVPEVLEKGGTVRRRKRRRDGSTRARRVRIRKRPFMLPALEAEAPKFPELYADGLG